jgi:hypothetical protein
VQVSLWSICVPCYICSAPLVHFVWQSNQELKKMFISLPWYFTLYYRSPKQKMHIVAIWGSKIWPWVPRDLDLRTIVLARASSNCKQQTCTLAREGAPHQQTHNHLTVMKIWSKVPDGCFIPRQTGRLIVGRNMTLTLINQSRGMRTRLKQVLSSQGRRVRLKMYCEFL